ncbi:MAG: OmpA family protein [Bacteroidales bacterium]|nr:OmpA family protein [Bacteroidales bacterium]
MMKRTLTIIFLTALAVVANAQDAQDAQNAQDKKQRNYLYINAGYGLSDVNFKLGSGVGKKQAGTGLSAAIGVGHYFTDHVGLSLGARFATSNATAKLALRETVTGIASPDLLLDNKSKTTVMDFSTLKDKTKESMIYVPIGLLLKYNLGQKWIFETMVNAEPGFVMKQSYSTKGAIRTTSSYSGSYDGTPVEIDEVPDFAGDGSTEKSGFKGDTDMKGFLFGAGAVCSLLYPVTECVMVGAGVYGSYTFTDQSNGGNAKLYDGTNYAGVVQSEVCTKVQPLAVGLTAGVRICFGGKAKQPKPQPEPIAQPQPVEPKPEPLPAPIESENKIDLKPSMADIMPTNYVYVSTSGDMSKQLQLKNVGDPIGSPITFATNSDKLLLDNTFSILDTVVIFLRENPDVTKMQIAAHTDDTGTEEYNLDLSNRRAKTVADYIIGKGIEPERLVTIGYGETRPLNNNATPEQREVNRRVEFTILELNGEGI